MYQPIQWNYVLPQVFFFIMLLKIPFSQYLFQTILHFFWNKLFAFLNNMINTLLGGKLLFNNSKIDDTISRGKIYVHNNLWTQ